MNNNRGSALITAFIAIMVIGIALTGVVGLSVANFNRAVANEDRTQAYYTARSALDIYREALLGDEDTLTPDLYTLKEEIANIFDGLTPEDPFFETTVNFSDSNMGTCIVSCSYDEANSIIKLTSTATKNNQSYTISFDTEIGSHVAGIDEDNEGFFINLFGSNYAAQDAGGNRKFEFNPNFPPAAGYYAIADASEYKPSNFKLGGTNIENMVIFVTNGSTFTMSGLSGNNHPQLTNSTLKRVYFILGNNTTLDLSASNFGTSSNSSLLKTLDFIVICLPGFENQTIIDPADGRLNTNAISSYGVYRFAAEDDEAEIPNVYNFPADFEVDSTQKVQGTTLHHAFFDPFAPLLDGSGGGGGSLSDDFLDMILRPQQYAKGD